jgi:gamma-glutamyltranspeptidase / glutathione hydrolase
VKIEEPVTTRYKGIDVYKLTTWTQGPVLLQALNLLEPLDLPSMGYNTTRYVHTLYQVMNLAFADRDFYYGDPDFPPTNPSAVCSRRITPGIDSNRSTGPGTTRHPAGRSLPLRRPDQPVPPSPDQLVESQASPSPAELRPVARSRAGAAARWDAGADAFDVAFRAGTTSIQAADRERMGDLRDAKRRLAAGLSGGPDRHGHEPADAELRPG